MRELTFDEMEFIGGGQTTNPVTVVTLLKQAWETGKEIGGYINSGINYYTNYMTSDSWAYYHQGGYTTGWSAYIC
jgi:hypothetical protein